MSQNNLDLAALVSSRICHDLISPIGAINNGLELFVDAKEIVTDDEINRKKNDEYAQADPSIKNQMCMRLFLYRNMLVFDDTPLYAKMLT
jgi:hypothetical protein